MNPPQVILPDRSQVDSQWYTLCKEPLMWGIVVLRWSLLAASLVVWLVQPGPKAEGAQPKPAFDKVVLTSSGGITGRGSGKALTVDCQGKFTAKMRDKQRQGELKPEELAQLAK